MREPNAPTNSAISPRVRQAMKRLLVRSAADFQKKHDEQRRAAEQALAEKKPATPTIKMQASDLGMDTDSNRSQESSPFDANAVEAVRFIELLVPRSEFEAVFGPMIADRVSEIRDLQSDDRRKLARFRICQLRIDLALQYLTFVSTTVFKRIKTIWTLG